MTQKTDVHHSLYRMDEAVRDFYERYPYPQPVVNLDKYRRRWKDEQRRRADFHLFWPDQSYREDHSILIAGCGTSQAAKHALRWPNAQVTGIDFSAASVHHTEQLKHKYHLDNLQVFQLSIERVDVLEMNFDQIICTGVLHHLADPDAGLRALRNVMKADGAMHLMVYAPYGRTGIYMLQEFCRRLGIRANDENIQDLITALGFLPSGHPLENLLREAPDFRQEAALADALLHPQDRAYSVPQFFDLVEKAGMTFGRWIRQAPYTPTCGIIAHLPQASRMTELPLMDQYASVELFRGTMLRHSAVLYRSDRPGGSPFIHFTGDAWCDYVPIRMPDTICVEVREQLLAEMQSEAEVVLINQAHTYQDIILPISFLEKKYFDAIDGKRTIGEIVKRMESNGSKKVRLNQARSLFERLWTHDQVVFQTKGTVADDIEFKFLE